MSLSNLFAVGTLAHAGTAAVRTLGAKTVAGVTGLSESMVYAMSSATDEARRWGSVPGEKLIALADELRSRQLPEFFSLAFTRFDAPDLPHPMQLLARMQALRGRTCEALCRLYDRSGSGPVVLGAADRKALIDTLDAEIAAITGFRNALLGGTSLPALDVWTREAPGAAQADR
jgi:hypothetical protein